MPTPPPPNTPPPQPSSDGPLPGLADWAIAEDRALRRNGRAFFLVSLLAGVCLAAFLALQVMAFKRDRDRLAAVHTGLPEEHILWLLGAPYESSGPPLPSSERPLTSDCPGVEPCYPDRCVRRVLYYRRFWTSLEVFYDADGVVQCVQRPMVMYTEHTW